MELTINIDGTEIASVPLPSGPPDRESESAAFDLAYEAKEDNPESVVSVTVDLDEGVITDGDLNAAAHALHLLADLDDGEDNVDGDALRAIADKFLMKTDAIVQPLPERLSAYEATTPVQIVHRTTRDVRETERQIVARIAREENLVEDHWVDLFYRLENGEEDALESAIALIRTHAIDPDHPLAVD